MDENEGKKAPEVRRVTQAPAPATSIGGGGLTGPREPERLRDPGFPTYYPNRLKARTMEVCLEAIRDKYRTGAEECCCQIVSDLTEDFRGEVQSGELRDDLAISAMQSYVVQFARYNSDGKDYLALLDAVDKSHAWLRFVKAMAATRLPGAKTGADYLRTGANQAESPVENNDNSTQTQKPRSALTPSKKSDPEVAKRRAIVKGNLDETARELCEILDRARLALPARWQNAGFNSWTQAYKRPDYRKRIDVLIAKDKHGD